MRRIGFMNWFFDGIGTELISALIGLIVGTGAGGTVGYRIGIRRNSLVQMQDAGNDSRQKQIGQVSEEEYGDNKENLNKISHLKISQKQKGGKNTIQSQIGGINNDGR